MKKTNKIILYHKSCEKQYSVKKLCMVYIYLLYILSIILMLGDDCFPKQAKSPLPSKTKIEVITELWLDILYLNVLPHLGMATVMWLSIV